MAEKKEVPSWILILESIDPIINTLKTHFELIAQSPKLEIEKKDLERPITSLNKLLNIMKRLKKDSSMNEDVKKVVSGKSRICENLILRIIGKIDSLTVPQSEIEYRRKLISIVSDCDEILKELKH